MKTDNKSMQYARELMQELFKLQDTLDILNNYDAKSYMYFITIHNNNKPRAKDVKIPMPASIKKDAVAYINQRIDEIKQELQKI